MIVEEGILIKMFFNEKPPNPGNNLGGKSMLYK